MKQFYLLIFILLSVVSSNAQLSDFKIPTTVPTTSSQLLKGGIPGPSPTIRIRCAASITAGNEPLYVVDGVVYEAAEIKWLDPNDIDEIHVLKENAAITIYSCRPMRGAIIITTKKAFHRKLFIKDASNLIGIGSATVKAVAPKTGKQFQFTADEFGRIETDSLRSMDYTLTISSTGYKTKTITLKNLLQNKAEVTLEREFVELKEVMIVAYPPIRCGSISSTCSLTSLCGQIRCIGFGVSVTEEKQTVKRSFNTKAETQIYPNPVAASGTINITFPNAMPGLYQIRLLHASGQLLYAIQKNIVKAETEQIQLSSKFVPGFYVVQIVNEKKQLVQSSKLVVR